MKKILLINFLLFLCFCRISFALEVETHKALNESIAEKNIQEFSLNTYLVDQLGFKDGINENIKYYFTEKYVYKWLGEGGKKEDDPIGSWPPATWLPVRAANHFHDPVSDTGWGPMSAIDWAFYGPNQQYFGSYYSWADVRNYFITALTYKDSRMREINFAETFRGLGQLMHLVEDMSVPDHTRNDGHMTYGYEKYLISGRYTTNIASINSNVDIAQVLTGTETSRLPIANLFDTNNYNGYNPAVTINSYIGLAEYTNANFLSPDTMFTEYAYPSEETSVTLDNNPIPDPRDPSAAETVTRQYYLKTNDGAQSQYKLACVSFTTHYTTTNIYDHSSVPQKAITLDDNVYKDYAGKLMPKAAGYASGILYYFFRGRLEITRPERYVYSIADGSVLETFEVEDAGSVEQQYFDYIKCKVRNSTDYNGGGDSPMGPGTLWAVAKYKKRKIYDPDLANDSEPPEAGEREEHFSYSVSSPISGVNLSATEAQEFKFSFYSDPIPAGITDLYLQVVYQGTLGNEIGTAVAVGMKDLFEPTHFVVMNATDRICVENILRTTQEVIDNETARDDPNNFKHCDDCSSNDEAACKHCTPCMFPFELKTRIAFGRNVPMGEDIDYDVVIDRQPAASYSRILFLTDEPFFTATIERNATDTFNSTCISEPIESMLPRASYHGFPEHLPLPSTINQEDSWGLFHTTPLDPIFGEFRDVNSHLFNGMLVATPLNFVPFDLAYQNWPSLEDSDPVPVDIMQQ